MHNDAPAAKAVTKWREIVRFEWADQLSRPSLWVLSGLFMFPLVGVTLDQLAGPRRADMLFHTPLFVAQAGGTMGLVALLILAVVVGQAATRDVSTRLEPLMRAAPVGRAAYLGGRFFGAFLVASAIMAAVPIVRLGIAMVQPAAPAEMGTFRAVAYLQTYLLVLLPNAWIAVAVMFTLATFVRHSLGAWLGAVALLALSQFSQSYFGDLLGR